MKVRPLICATTPHYDEDPATLARARDSLPAFVYWYEYEAPLRRLAGGSHVEGHGRHFGTESELRNFGRMHAQQIGAEWWLQLDADEQLFNGEQLPAILEHWPTPTYPSPRCYPLPRVEEDGAVSFCPYKLVRLPCRLACGCDHFTFDAGLTVWRLSVDRSATEQERPALRAGPHLLHEPSRRTSSRPRLGTLENELEKRPAYAVEWPLPVPMRAR
jgi:hypothetical protein